MRLRELRIKNFRKIEDVKINFPRGLSVIIGENNAGKTAIIDALRLMLLSSRDYDALRINEDDFRFGSDFVPIEISCIFSELKEADEVHFQECLIDLGDGHFEIQLNARIEYNKTTRRPNIRMWGGETEGGSLPSNLYDHIASIYLQPLRDPENGLRPGRRSQISRLIECLTKEEQYGDFEDLVKEANEKIRKLKPVKTAAEDLNTQLNSIAGEKLAQKTELIFSDPTFHRIIAGLHPEIDGLPFALNGLGYNNLVFTAATLGTLRESPHFSYRSILVEEPEAHLHPQLQVLLLRYFADVAEIENGKDVQVITSSHSPILASQAPIDSIICVHEHENKVSVVSVCSINIDEIMKKKLQRFLDATRGELFFARKILMVEGIAEALLLPILAKKAGGCLKKSAVTIVNVDGLNFNAFLPLFKKGGLNIPVVVLTDADPTKKGDNMSPTAAGLKKNESEISNLLVVNPKITLEHELALSPGILSLMQKAFESLHPIKGKSLRQAVEKIDSSEEKAAEFLKTFKETGTSKGCFAQELATLIETATLKAEEIPAYIRNALDFLGVIQLDKDDEKSGKFTKTNSCPAAH